MNWEYIIRDNLDEDSLNEYGEEGWELVYIDECCSYFSETRSIPKLVFYLKRPKQ